MQPCFGLSGGALHETDQLLRFSGPRESPSIFSARVGQVASLHRGMRPSAPVVWFLFPFIAGCSLADSEDQGEEPFDDGTTGGFTSSGGVASGSGGESTTGGTNGAGGSGGLSAGGGTGGGSQAGGTEGTDPNAPTPSAGCNLPSSQMTATWVAQDPLMIDGTPREWSVWMPEGYDPERAYPVVFLFHGCTSGTNNLPMQNVTGEDAIVVRGTGILSDICWDWFPSDGVEVQFFDAMVAALQESRCVDTSRYFGVGYSSGSYLLSMLGCYRAHVLRAAASVAGGSYSPARTNCSGTIARMFVHDLQDDNNDISGSERERDRLMSLNSCDTELAPVAEAPSPCVRYQGCDAGYPVVWCATSGQNHGRQDSFASAFWDFFSEL